LLSTTLAVCVVATAPAADPPGVPIPALPATTEPAAITLAGLEQMAMRNNPTLAQATSNVEAARGRTVQSGLYPNPTFGYNGEQIGLRGRQYPGEQQGAFVDQTIVTAGKLRLNRARYGQEVTQAEWLSVAQQYRVLNGVRMRFYQLLAMRQLIEVRAGLLKNAEDAVTTTEQLVNVGAANRPDLLQARIEARRERVALQNARTLYAAALKQLAAFIGKPDLAGQIAGNLEQGTALPGYEESLAHLLGASPEVQIAKAEVIRNQYGLRRERVEPIPNVNVRVASGYNFGNDARTVTTSVQVGVKLPIYNRNQGNIHTAAAQLARSQAEIGRVELSLRQRLARAYARYQTAAALVKTYRTQNLPEAKEAYELYLDSFRRRRAAWPQVLVSQRTYFQISEEYVSALEEVRRQEVAILGLLLVDGLDEPPGPPSNGQRPRQEGQPPDLPDPINSRGGRGMENRTGASASSPGG
jgi:cobalt-zinc-cadmium efflux system outer membrane protein